MKREPTEEEREMVLRAIAVGDRIEAIRIYLSITDCGLTDAQEFIKARTDQLQLQTSRTAYQLTRPMMGW
jgi:ribosomal protein L7/L12